MSTRIDPSGGNPLPSPGSPGDRPDVLDWARREGAADRVIADLNGVLRRRSQRRRRTILAVAAVLIMGGVVGEAWRRVSPAGGPIASVARDAVVLRPVLRTLPDGSVVELKSGAEIDVDFTVAQRRVVLRGGEGFFQVTKDPQRPFIVAAGGIEVRAVGTAFVVDRAARRVEVIVTEGRVAIEQTDAPVATNAAAATRDRTPLGTLNFGGKMVVTLPATTQPTRAAAEITTVSAQAIQQRLAQLRVPRLEFAATPLARVVVLFNEHAALHGGERLVLDDPALGRVLLSGLLRADDIESLLLLLEREFQIRSERQRETIVLRRG